jgi:rhamnogalacturonyl hydrolase YesR
MSTRAPCWIAAVAALAMLALVPDASPRAADWASQGTAQAPAGGAKPRLWSVALAETVMERFPDYNLAYHASWTYVHGYTLLGFDMLYRATGDRRYYDFIRRYIDAHVDEGGSFRPVIDGRGRMRDVAFTNQDNMMTGNTLVLLYEYTRDDRYKKAATTIRRALDDYPRNSNGGLWHARSMHGQWWIDGIFMSQMFLLRYGKSIGDAQYCFDEATRQITAYARAAEKGASGMMVHGTFEAGHGEKTPPRWADPKTGLSPEVWSEGLGWYVLVTVETLATIPGNHPGRVEVEAIFRRVAAGLERTQDPGTGGWFTVVDKQDQPGNWIDSSGTAMFAYALQRGIELGLLRSHDYTPVVERAYQALTRLMTAGVDGLVDVHSASDGLGVQPDYGAYVNNPKRVVNAKEAVAGMLWATTIVERSRLPVRR